MKIKLVHLLTDIESEREKSSIKSLSSISNYGIKYVQHINEIYTGTEYLTKQPIYPGNHRPGHYGLFQSFKKAIEQEFDDDLDAIIICECDCVISIDLDKFSELAREAVSVCKSHLINYVSFGSPGNKDNFWSPVIEDHPNYGSFYLTDKIILCHCILFPRHSKEYLLRQLNSGAWDTLDVWLNWSFRSSTLIPPKRFAVSKKTIAYQHEGISLLDNVWKGIQ
jgi:hypothetical protein